MNKAENNRLIAEFLGYTQPHPDYPTTSYWYKEGEEPLVYLSFNTDWNWLMKAVVECFNKQDATTNDDLNFKLNDALLETNINSLYKAVVEFIQEYNKRPFRIYGIEIDDIPEDFDYENCSDERFMDEAERCGLVWEDFDEFIEQLNNGDINKEYTRFRTIKV
jgi:hypothetical protein